MYNITTFKIITDFFSAAIGKPNVCEDSWFGCCPDGKTPAQGAEFFGCPSHCGCNKLGNNK